MHHFKDLLTSYGKLCSQRQVLPPQHSWDFLCFFPSVFNSGDICLEIKPLLIRISAVWATWNHYPQSPSTTMASLTPTIANLDVLWISPLGDRPDLCRLDQTLSQTLCSTQVLLATAKNCPASPMELPLLPRPLLLLAVQMSYQQQGHRES